MGRRWRKTLTRKWTLRRRKRSTNGCRHVGGIVSSVRTSEYLSSSKSLKNFQYAATNKLSCAHRLIKQSLARRLWSAKSKATKEGGSMIRRFVAWSRRRRGRMRLRSLLMQLQLHLQQLPSALPQLHQRYSCSTQPQLHQRQFILQQQEVVNRALDWFIPQISSNRVLVTSLPHNHRRDQDGERLHKSAMCRVNKKGQIPKAKALFKRLQARPMQQQRPKAKEKLQVVRRRQRQQQPRS